MNEHEEMKLLNWWVKSIKEHFGEELEDGPHFPEPGYYHRWRDHVIKHIWQRSNK